MGYIGHQMAPGEALHTKTDNQIMFQRPHSSFEVAFIDKVVKKKKRRWGEFFNIFPPLTNEMYSSYNNNLRATKEIREQQPSSACSETVRNQLPKISEIYTWGIKCVHS